MAGGKETKVVDLLRYRNARRTYSLPLFDTPTNPPLHVTIEPFRVLSAREVSHRVRMLSHLRAVPAIRP